VSESDSDSDEQGGITFTTTFARCASDAFASSSCCGAVAAAAADVPESDVSESDSDSDDSDSDEEDETTFTTSFARCASDAFASSSCCGAVAADAASCAAAG